jgi:hypothetical protein
VLGAFGSDPRYRDRHRGKHRADVAALDESGQSEDEYVIEPSPPSTVTAKLQAGAGVPLMA